jgi:ankyrin repeat protein
MRSLQAMLALGAVAAVLSNGAQAQAPTHPNLNAQLLVAARQGDLNALERSIASGAAPNSRNRLGKTALLIAAEKGNLDMAQRMLAAGADVNLASLEGVTPLMAAAFGGHAAIAAAYEQRLTALMWAAGQGQGEAVKLLLARGAKTDLRDDRGLTAAQIAQQAGHAQIAQALAVK